MNRIYTDAVYSGWVGKIVGVIHGANIEGWTAEEIRRTFGKITDMPFHFRNFCADDDINGPLFFQRAITDFGPNPTDEELAETFLNYVSDGHGFFWWGGYGVSTEHTAYENLSEGIPASLSGSEKLNGPVLANQIGGQIFVDCWGFMCPGKPKMAADLAERMAGLTHDGDGREGARFVAAAIAAAFTADDISGILDAACHELRGGSRYAAMVRDVRSYAQAHADDPEGCFQYVKKHYDYRFYPGVCHIIPNAAVMVMSLICGQGSFEKTINIAAMCGWDTDCNEGNLGSILGVFCGIDRLPKKWKEQVHDLVVASSSLGGLNLQTVSQAAEETLRAAVILGNWKADERWQRILSKPEGHLLHFTFPESTCNLQTRTGCGQIVIANEKKSDCCLKLVHKGIGNSGWMEIFVKSYYLPTDFDDNRYQPDLAPILYPGDHLRFVLSFDEAEIGKEIRIVPFFKDRMSGQRIDLKDGSNVKITEAVTEVTVDLPSGEDVLIEEAGFRITAQNIAPRETSRPMVLYLKEAERIPDPDYRMNGSAIFEEVWTAVDTNPVGFSTLRGIAEAADGKLGISGSGKSAEAYTGDPFWKDYTVRAGLIPVRGSDHFVMIRVQGGARWYGAGLIEREGNKYLAILKKKRKITILDKIPYVWNYEEMTDLAIEARGDLLKVFIGGKEMLAVKDPGGYRYGCIGFGNQNASRTGIVYYEVNALNTDGTSTGMEKR